MSAPTHVTTSRPLGVTVTAVLILGLLLNADRAADRRPPRVVPLPADHQRPARTRPGRRRHRQGSGPPSRRQLVEVLGQKKLLKWSVPGAAHFFVFWAFVILATVYLEAYGALIGLLVRRATPSPGRSRWSATGRSWGSPGLHRDDGVLRHLRSSSWIRLRNAPEGPRPSFALLRLAPARRVDHAVHDLQRHLDDVPVPGCVIRRSATCPTRAAPSSPSASATCSVADGLGLPHSTLEFLEGLGLLLHIGVMLAFLIFVLNSKHLHIFVAPINVLFGRRPVALGAVKP